MFIKLLSKNYLTIIVSLFIISVNPNSIAHASDGKSWSGSLCQAYYGYDETWFNKYYSGLYNRSSTSKWASCGVVRDRYGKIGTNKARVYVVASASRKTTCYLSERYTSGGAYQTRSASRFGSGYIYLDTSKSRTHGNNARIVVCYVPSGARIASVYVSEH